VRLLAADCHVSQCWATCPFSSLKNIEDRESIAADGAAAVNNDEIFRPNDPDNVDAPWGRDRVAGVIGT
jgi:hypothetical protein